MRTAVLLPALNEATSLPLVLQDLRPYERAQSVHRVLVVDNGSSDGTPDIARQMGVEVITEPRRGYGSACLAGLEYLRDDPPQILVILDADHSDDVRDLPKLLEPILSGQADMVLGERTTLADPGALLPNQRVGNALATRLIHLHTGHRYRDMGPFRALRWEALEALQMEDAAFGWNVEMQMKAIQRGLRVQEVPVRYRKRVGHSKISGTVKGTLKAGAHILRATWRYRA